MVLTSFHLVKASCYPLLSNLITLLLSCLSVSVLRHAHLSVLAVHLYLELKSHDHSLKAIREYVVFGLIQDYQYGFMDHKSNAFATLSNIFLS